MKSVYFLFLSNLLSFIDLSVTFTFFSLECKAKGLSENIIGVIVTSEVLGRFISNLLTEKMSIFEKKSIMIVTQAGIVLCVLNYTLIDYFDSSLAFALLSVVNRIAQGFFYGKNSIINTAWIGDYAKTDQEYQKLMMYYGNTRGLGLCVGSALGAMLYSFFGYKLLFVILAGLTLICLILFVFFAYIPKNVAESKTVEKNSLELYTTCLKNKVFFFKFILAVVSRISYFYIVVDYSINMSTRFALSASTISLLLAIPALLTIIVLVAYGYLHWRSSASLHLQIGMILAALGSLFLAPCNIIIELPQEIWLVVIGTFFLEASLGLFSIKLIESLYETMIILFPSIPKAQLNRAGSNFYAMNWAISFAIGPLYIGFSTYYLSLDYSVFIFACVLLGIYVLYFIFGEGYVDILNYYYAVMKKNNEENDEGRENNGQKKNYEDFQDDEELK